MVYSPCALQNYDKKELMKIALPIAVQFLPKGNKELSRNLASYLSLAAIDYAYLLIDIMDPIMDSILSGNYGLLRVLSQVYEVSPKTVTPFAPQLIPLLPQCDAQERMAVFQLYLLIVQKSPAVLESCVPQLCGFLQDSDTSSITMQILLKLAQHAPHLLVDHFEQVRLAAKANPSTITLCAQVLTTSGIGSKETAQQALDFVLEHLPAQALLQQEATRLCSAYPVLFTDKVLACVRQKNAALSSQHDVGNTATSSTAAAGNKISGGVTIVSLNSSSPSSSAQLKPGKQTPCGCLFPLQSTSISLLSSCLRHARQQQHQHCPATEHPASHAHAQCGDCAHCHLNAHGHAHAHTNTSTSGHAHATAHGLHTSREAGRLTQHGQAASGEQHAPQRDATECGQWVSWRTPQEHDATE